MKNLKKEYQDLEMKVLRTLREIVENSQDESRHIRGNCLYLYDYRAENIDFDYCELCIIGDRLVLINIDGYHFSAAETDLQTLIDIIEFLTQ